MAGDDNGFGGSYQYGVENDVFYGGQIMAPTGLPSRMANILIVTGLALVGVAMIFMPVATFDAGRTSGDVAYSDMEWGGASDLSEFVHLGVTRWIGLALALACLAVCAKRISDQAVTLVSTVCGLAGAAYLGLATLLVRSEILDIADISPASFDVEIGLGVWVALAGAATSAVGCIAGFASRPREAADITTAYAPPPP
jgi:hypothetical protein